MEGKPFKVKFYLESNSEQEIELKDETYSNLQDKETYVFEVIPEGPVHGEVKIIYNHYNKSFPIVDGCLKWETIDDMYAFSYVF